MTREEREIAVEELREEAIDNNNENLHREREQAYMQGYEDASKRFRQEPSGDAISRQATIEAFQMFRGYEANRTNAEWVDRIETMVKKLPPVNPQPQTGHWIWCVGSHKCSNCEEYTCFSHKELLRYCPNCGAKMVEPQESEGI